MFKTENEIQSSEVHLIPQIRWGLGYQLAAALLRLGRKVSSLKQISEDLEKIDHLKISFYSQSEIDLQKEKFKSQDNEIFAVFLCPEMEVSLNKPPSSSTIQKLLNLAEKFLAINPELHLITLLPKSVSKEDVMSFQLLSHKSTVFLSPATYGFRDRALLDFALKNPFHLKKFSSINDKLSIAFSRDIVAYVLSAFNKSDCFGKTYILPEQISSLKEWQSYFEKTFKKKSILSKEGLKSLFSKTEFPPLSNMQGSAFELELLKAEDFFPNAPSKTERSLNLIFEQNQKHPELETHFPPPRAL
ncbi:MAG: hypothetical protein KA116_06930 [Proteobacteria bacterium]|nr:hypothetical protein [Pseudomonadota bacterium]